MSFLSREKAWELLTAAKTEKVPDRVYADLATLIVAFELRHLNDTLDKLVDYQTQPTTKKGEN